MNCDDGQVGCKAVQHDNYMKLNSGRVDGFGGLRFKVQNTCVLLSQVSRDHCKERIKYRSTP